MGRKYERVEAENAAKLQEELCGLEDVDIRVDSIGTVWDHLILTGKKPDGRIFSYEFNLLGVKKGQIDHDE